MFQLCPCGGRIKLRGHAAGWHGELGRRVIVSIPAPMAPWICVAPVVPKEAPELITVTVRSLENYTLQHSKPKPRRATMKDGSKIFNLKPPLPLGPFCSISVQRFGAAVTGPGLRAQSQGETETSLQSRVRQQQASG